MVVQIIRIIFQMALEEGNARISLFGINRQNIKLDDLGSTSPSDFGFELE